MVDPGLYISEARAKLVVDKDDDTFAAYQFVGIGEAIIAGGGDVVFRFTPNEAEQVPDGATPTAAEIRFLAGWTRTPQTAQWEVYLRENGQEIAGTRFLASSLTPAGLPAQFISGIEEFTHTIDASIASRLADIEVVLHPVTGVVAGVWVAREVSIRGSFEPPLPVIDATQDVRNSVTNYFEVTDQLNTVNGDKDWGSFADVSSLGRAEFSGLAGDELRIVETFWVVEFTPFTQVSSRAPRVFADIIAPVPDGDPTEIAKALITAASPLGMGLTLSSIDQASYLAAQTGLLADGVRADFAVVQQTSAIELLRQLASQTDCRSTWEDGRNRIIRRPRADTLLTVQQTFNKDALRIPRQLALSRSGRAGVRNRIDVRWRRYAPTGDTSRSDQLDDAPSQAEAWGVQQEELVLSLIADDAAAALVATRRLERLRRPRWVVEFEVPLHGITLRPGDLISLASPDFTFAVGEVTQVNIQTTGFKRVQIQATVWEE